MGQNIKYVITTENMEVPINIVHFKEKNTLIFPFVMHDSEYETLCEMVIHYNNSAQKFLFSPLNYMPLEYPTDRLFHFLGMRNTQNLALIAHAEFNDFDYEVGHPILFINDQLIQIDAWHEQQVAHEKLGAEVHFHDIIRDEQKYFCYESAEIFYLKNLNI
jgi:hypothetical protein